MASKESLNKKSLQFQQYQKNINMKNEMINALNKKRDEIE